MPIDMNTSSHVMVPGTNPAQMHWTPGHHQILVPGHHPIIVPGHHPIIMPGHHPIIAPGHHPIIMPGHHPHTPGIMQPNIITETRW